ncbi:MAG: WGR domain-containing protein [Gammaproteobacteria bacterium]|nr:WGR domain-containing protein [Gammaproteobacteria bacterium]MBU2478598.1 WGR domain-containing protein [Gammaproteobacteria bacterium]
MQTPVGDDASPRYYHLHLQEDLLGGWTLVREWGRQGASGRVVKQHYTDRDGAEQALLLVRDEQLKRGFRVVFIQGQEQP